MKPQNFTTELTEKKNFVIVQPYRHKEAEKIYVYRRAAENAEVKVYFVFRWEDGKQKGPAQS